MPSEKSFKQRRTFGERPGEGRAARWGPPVLPAAEGCGGGDCRVGKERRGEGAMAVRAAKIPGRLLLTAGPRWWLSRCPGLLGAAAESKPGPSSRVVYLSRRFGTGGC